MSIDLAQFHQVFFEESFEGLDAMETGLLDLDIGDVDSEEINTIFRAAHSIKGGAGTFGFMEVSNFTHVMETLLDEMRDGRRQVTQPTVDVLLKSVDFLREMLTAIQDGEEVDKERMAECQDALNTELNGNAASSQDDATEQVETPENTEQARGWQIVFCPHEGLMQNGNDPVRMLRELETLGDLTVKVDYQRLPNLYDMDPESCYLSWDLRLEGEDISRENIDDIFAWVEDDCDMAIRPIGEQAFGVENPVAAELASDETPDVQSEQDNAQPVSSSQSTVENSTPTKKKPASPKQKKANPGSSSIRVDTDKIDTLINMVGELVITQSMLSLLGDNFEVDKVDQLKTGLVQLERHTRELQESVMNIRMLPISFVFSRFPRLVHDLSSKLGKQIELKLSGEHTEVDKTVIELLSDPLVHLVRNSLDHGIEMPDVRVAAGKPELGTVHLNAFHRGGNIVIEISDDGKGLDAEMLKRKAIEKGLIDEAINLTEKQCFELIFMAGFSTAEQLSDVSGRGVGMDVVRRNIQSLGGSIEIRSDLGKGSTIAIHLPLTLAILDGQSIAVGDETYIVPLVSIIESVNLTSDMINRVIGRGETFKLRDEYLPIVRMHEIFGIDSAKATSLTEGLVVVVEGQGTRCGLFVDDLLGQQQVVIKSLEANYRRVEGVSGATILGDGSVALILDIPGLVRLSNQQQPGMVVNG